MCVTIYIYIYKTVRVMIVAAQVHRRSEGCLDLSSVGRGTTWPHLQQQPQHHRASLPAVQLHTPFRHAFHPLPPDPLAPPGHFLLSHQDCALPSRPPPPSPLPPPGHLGSSSSSSAAGTCGSGSGNGSLAGGVGGSGGGSSRMMMASSGSGGMMMMSGGLQWSSYGGGCGTEMRGSGTWPLYHQPVNMPMG